MNKKLITMTFLSVLMSAFNTAQAEDEYYKWVDERGVTHYSETQPDDSKIKAERVNVSTYIPRGSEQAISNLQQQRSRESRS
jgi:ABC-type transporter MlaC component